jgi:hypothetical protein
MPQQRFRTRVGEESFEFDWDKDTTPTQEEILTLYKEKNPAKKSLWERVKAPLTDAPSRWGKAASDYITTPSADESPTMARVKGFLGGATEGVGDLATQMTSPLDIAATVTGLGAVRRGVTGANTAFKVASGLTGARGAQNIYEGVSEKDPAKVGAGALEGTMALLGARSPVPKKKPLLGENLRQVDVMPPSSVPRREPVAVPLAGARVNPVEGGVTTKDRAVSIPSLENNMYGIKATGNEMFPSVPNRMQSSTNQNVFDALIPSRVKDQIGQAKKLENPDNIAEPIKQAVSSSNPVIAKAAQEVVATNSAANKPAAKKGGFLSNAKRMAEEWAYKPMLSVIKEDSEAGKGIGRMMEKAYADYSTWAGQTSSRISKATSGLSEQELANLPRAIQGKEVPLNSKVQDAMSELAKIDDEFMERATKAGLQMRTAGGKTVPFEKQDNYWARIYSDDFLKAREVDIRKEMMAKGMAPQEIDDILANSRQFGNRLIDSQHGRKADVEGYRLDVDSQKHHYSDLAKRIVEAETFGNMDTADAKSPISTLLSQTKDSTRVKGLVDQYLGRAKGGDKGYVHDVANAINKFQVAVQLPLFAIKNQSQKAMIPIRANIAEFTKALGQYTTKEGKEIAENTGAFQSIRDIIHEMGGESKISKYYGISKTEEGNRGLAAITGKGTSARLFDKLKKNPADKVAREQLDELILEDIDTVLKQDALTPEQMNRAGFRMAELTQGSANPMNLPSKWSEHPEVKILTLYKRFALQQSKLIKDSIMQNPTKNLPTALFALAAAGEVTGDVYTGVKSTLQGKDPGEEIANRGADGFVNDMMQRVTNDKDISFLVSRVARDLSDAMALGLIQDFIEAGGGGTRSLLNVLAGPTIGNLDKLVTATGRSVRTGSVKPVAKELTKQVTPVPVNIPLSNLFGQEREKKRGVMPSF